MNTADALAMSRWKNNKKKCQNPGCPNGHKISIAIFRGSGYCSDNCRKALGQDLAPQVRH